MVTCHIRLQPPLQPDHMEGLHAGLTPLLHVDHKKKDMNQHSLGLRDYFFGKGSVQESV